jgi:hypothetical protein
VLTADAVLHPLDRVRSRLLRALGPLARWLVADRELRVAVQGVLVVVVALGLAAGVPLWLLALGPVSLGVPHVLADLRYCVVRPGYHQRTAWQLGVAAPLGALVLGADLWVGVLAVAGGFVAANGAAWKRGIGVALALSLAWMAASDSRAFTLGLAHLHNFVAVGLWWAWRSRKGALHLLPLAAFALACAFIVGGGLDATAAMAARVEFLPGLGMDKHLRTLARGVDPHWGVRWVLLYAFAQSVHYSMWLRMLPDEDRDRVSPRTFRRSWRVLKEEVSAPLVWLTVVATVGVAGWAVFDLARARFEYLHFARFHGVLELATAATLLIEGRPKGDP